MPSLVNSRPVPGVPWVATWSKERTTTALLDCGPGGLRWFNEGPHDRDGKGALWARKAQRIGAGRPEYAGIHPRRQKCAMEHLLCHVCGGPSSMTKAGVLWMEPITPGQPLLPHSSHPPVCLPCAVEARDRCTPLRRRGAHVFRVGTPRPWGVLGTRYVPGPGNRPVPREPVEVSYSDPAIHWTLASQMIMAFDDITVVDLDDEYDRYLGELGARPAAATRRRPPQPPLDSSTAAPYRAAHKPR